MQTVQNAVLGWTLGLCLGAAPCWALNKVPGTLANGACHPLMTAQECHSHQTQLALLNPVDHSEQRERFLAAHRALMQEREAACDCSRLFADDAIPSLPTTVMHQF